MIKNSMKRILLCLFVGACLVQTAQAQLQYGFKTGVNFSRFNGPSETNLNGMELETFDNITGFHIGATLTYEINDAFSLQTELLFSKQGTKYTYEGQGYRYFRDQTNTKLANGNIQYQLNVNNAYVAIPILAQGRWKDLEISGGFYGGFLLSSNGEGAFTFTGKTVPLNNTVYGIYEGSGGAQVEDIEYLLDHNYRKDGIGEATGDELFKVRADNQLVEQSKQVGAYYDFTEDRGSIYNNFDYGLMGGLTWYISSSLYLGGRFQFGLGDVTNNDADMAKASLGDNGEVLYRDDKDKNLMIQISVGFKF